MLDINNFKNVLDRISVLYLVINGKASVKAAVL